MIAFEVLVNGKKVCTAGVGRPDILEALLFLEMKPAHLNVWGAIRQQKDLSEILNWLRRYSLEVGDQVTVRIIESEMVDDPLPRRRIIYSCSFCLERESFVDKLIVGKGVRICGQCVTDFLKIAESGGEQDGTNAVSEEDRCSFCGEPRTEVEMMFSRNDRRICDQCLARCRRGVFGDARRNGKIRPVPYDN